MLVFHDVSGCSAPIIGHLLLDRLFYVIKETLIFGSFKLLCIFQLCFCQHGFVIGGIRSKLCNKRFAIGWNMVNFITALLHSCQKQPDAFDAVKSCCAANIRIAWRIIMKNNRDLFLIIAFMAQDSPFTSLINCLMNAFSDRYIAVITVIKNFLIGNRQTVDNSIQFRHGYAYGNLHGIHAFNIVLPLIVVSH